MVKNKLTDTLLLFSKEELKQLGKFVSSDFFNSGSKAQNIVLLFETIRKGLKRGGFAGSNSELYECAFPGEPVVSGKLEKLMSALLKLIERFIELNYYDDFYGENQKLLVQAIFFRKRKADHFYESKIKKIKSVLKKTKLKDESYFLNNFFTAQEIEISNERFNMRKEDLNLPETLQNLDIFYLYHRLKSTVSILAQNIHTKIQVNSATKIIDGITDLIQNEEYLQIPVIKVYFYAYTLLKDYGKENHKFYLEFREYLHSVSDSLPPPDNKSLRTLIRIYATGQYNSGKVEFLGEAFSLYKLHLEEGFLYYENKIRPSTLQSLVALGLRLKKFDWVFDFLQEHRNRLIGTRQPENVYSYNLAYYHFYKGNFEEASNLLDDFYEDFYYKVNAKRLEIQIFYEQNSSLFEHKLEAFKVYIFRVSKKNLPEKARLANNNFIDLLKQIVNPKTRRNPERIEQIKRNLNKKKILTERDWLLEKLSEELR